MNRPWLVASIAVAVAFAMLVYVLSSHHSSGDLRAHVQQQMSRLVADHRRLEAELAHEPFLDAGKGPMEAYLARIRRDGVPQHSEMRRKLAAIAEDNAELLALAEAYESAAKSEAWPDQLRALRTYVITWNERWNGLFETFMAGGNLAGGEPPFPPQFAEVLKSE
jgi:hypothetical protein